MPVAQTLALKDALVQALRALTDPDMDAGERETIVYFLQLQYLKLDRALQVAA